MDFLDPKKQRAHSLRMTTGYVILALAMLLATTILVYQARGYGIDKNGRIIQNGLVFFSSQPGGAAIRVNGVQKGQTNTRLVLPAGAYTIQLERQGYRTWQRAITVDGSVVERFDYPFLVPTTLTTTLTKQYTAQPGFVAQSPNRQWLLLQSGAAADQFDVFDLTVAKPVARPLVVPSDGFTAGSTTTGWQLVHWADDNRHVLLKRLFDKQGQAGSEYILLDRQDPSQTQNLTTLLGFNPATILLKDGAYDQYYVYDQNAGQVFTATLKKPSPVPLLQDVQAFAADGTTLLYVTADGAAPGKVLIRLRQNDRTYTLREGPAGTQLLALANYSGTRYVAAGAQDDSKVYVYRDPAGTLDSNQVLVPVQILKTTTPTALTFSDSARFVMAENATQFSVYDAETNKGYAFTAKDPLDAPQANASWMDGFHLTYVSGGKTEIFDFDGTNVQALAAAVPAFAPFFTPNYHTLYTVNAVGALTSTSLIVQ
ncbi:MAG TPA: PEGA domain-containing protein [Candidatus Saccharimonadales bacterium]|nr:PEGA domain-containing protein [Candidatus Saccharimonadales bacterium]